MSIHTNMSSGWDDRAHLPSFDLESDLLMPDRETLYAVDPSQIASSVQARLNAFEQSGRTPTQIVMIPDHHSFSGDGGVKNILFITRPRTDLEAPRSWLVFPMSSDNATYYESASSNIASDLMTAIKIAHDRGQSVQFTIPLVDHHDFITGCHGEDGLKTLLLCATK